MRMIIKFIFTWIPRLMLGAVILFLIISTFAFFMHPGEPPSIEKAPWVIQTYSLDDFRIPSRYYYAESVEYVDSTPVAKGHWWSYDGKNYHKHSKDKPFTVDEYGIVDIRRR